MPLQEIKSKPETTVFMISDMADVQITVSRINNPLFIKEASAIDRSLIGTMVSELGTNIIKYAGRGLIRMAQAKGDGTLDIEMWAEDKGPGIANIALAMKDHFTTGNTLGLGLPGVRRMADHFSIQSEQEDGTIVYARKRIKGSKRAVFSDKTPSMKEYVPVEAIHAMWDIGSHNRPMPGEYVSGDCISIVEFGPYLLLSIADVSGHGLKAHELSAIISTYIQENVSRDLAGLMTGLHKILVGTLGAAVGFLLIDIPAQTFQYLGVGNTGANRCVGEPWKGVSRDGVLGQRLPGFYAQAGFLKNGDVFSMWSDGISDHAGSNFVKTHVYESSEKIAHDLVAELGKAHDDASCIIFKWLA
ncbi:SpoIIE family protein phosphatase [Polynucleobacter sp. 71A-WALBACH]|uniref:ATP-binding SpoIIE family protein phosphatase n=1 Tax=Polynucleobacter sp. 71A-WALBACH TaxID=2689097 RepID=UPI001C0CAE63|nr:ATP-binding SpoIIE family protein phosphatase [Polynucleobacter sp. 71A-WALBACH]MBU3593707.1 SpoIIE family protein phosphatase [Polynucleobacter sp. 71A-WALBACH]